MKVVVSLKDKSKIEFDTDGPYAAIGYVIDVLTSKTAMIDVRDVERLELDLSTGEPK